MKYRWPILALAACLVVGGAWFAVRARARTKPSADRLLLLLPDDASFSDPRVTVWLDAASEEGLHIVPMHDSTYLRPLFEDRSCAGIILPDATHIQASDVFVSTIRHYVQNGGHLMLVYDAGTKTPDGFYPSDRSRFSDLAGVDYAFYKNLGASMIRSSEVSAPIPVMQRLGIAPGKFFPFADPAKPHAAPVPAKLRRYQFGDLEYPSFVTSETYSGEVLLHSDAGIAAGSHPLGKGSVLFVNLPVTSLAESTDGLPLHAFLKYFAQHVLALPFFLSVPDGIGGMVLDWHVDSNAAIKSLQEVSTWSLMRQGPYSIDITAGPDTYRHGDHEGFDLPNNPTSRELVRQLMKLGNEIGSHGGWIHDYFAHHVDKDPPGEMEKFLALNKSAIEEATGKPDLEYSAPNGNQPEWVTQWIADHGFIAYYFTGDTGMGPTQGYRDGRRDQQNIWAFPISHMDRAASFEEMTIQKIPDAAIQQWLDALTDFVANRRQVRLAYFHPPGILPYRPIVDRWMKKTAQLRNACDFRWYTMVQISNFLNARKNVMWHLTEKNGIASLDASGATTLAHDSWFLPATRYEKPAVVRGAATIQSDPDGWIVVAGEESQFEIQARMK
jgi:hypothetical protein